MITIRLYPGRSKASKTTIRASMNFGKKKFQTSSSVKIDPNYWNQSSQTVEINTGSPDIDFKLNKKMNKKLTKLKNRLTKTYVRILAKEGEVTYDRFCSEWELSKKKMKSDDLLNFYSEIFLKEVKVGDYELPLCEDTQEKYEISLKKFGLFYFKNKGRNSIKYLDKKEINKNIRGVHVEVLFDNFNSRPSLSDANNKALVKSFKDWLMQSGYRINTYGDPIKHLKRIISVANDNGYVKKNNISSIKIKHEEIDPVYLTEDEIQKIENVEGLNQTESLVRDWIIILLHTGFRKGDMLDLCKEHIVKESEIIHKIQMKNRRRKIKYITIPLHYKVKRILKKHGGFPPITTYRNNFIYHLRNVCKKAGINSYVEIRTTIQGKAVVKKKLKWSILKHHDLRRSFATQAIIKGWASLDALKELMSHAEIEMTLKYIGDRKTRAVQEMAKKFKEEEMKELHGLKNPTPEFDNAHQ